MDFPRVSRNDPCPCGSGRKFKKCCYYGDRTITQLDRVLAIELIEQFVGSCDARHEARAIFCGNLDDDVPAMTEHFREASDSAFLFWFAFDYQLDDGCYVVDQILSTDQLMSDGVRRYLEQMRTTALIPYEVMSVRPGSSVTLRRLGTQQEIEVREKTASRTLKRWDMLVARLNPLSPSGGSEIEMGLMLIPKVAQEEIAAIVSREPGQRSDGDDDLHRSKELGPLFHTIWLETIVAPKLPTCLTADGDPLMFVTLRFDVRDEQWLRTGLDAEPGLEQDGDDVWLWVADGSLLGTIRLTGSQLTLETQSVPRAERGRRLIARIARGAAEYQSSDRVDPMEEVRKLIESGKWAEPRGEVEDEIPPDGRQARSVSNGPVEAAGPERAENVPSQRFGLLSARQDQDLAHAQVAAGGAGPGGPHAHAPLHGSRALATSQPELERPVAALDRTVLAGPELGEHHRTRVPCLALSAVAISSKAVRAWSSCVGRRMKPWIMPA